MLGLYLRQEFVCSAQHFGSDGHGPASQPRLNIRDCNQLIYRAPVLKLFQIRVRRRLPGALSGEVKLLITTAAGCLFAYISDVGGTNVVELRLFPVDP